MIIFYNQKYDLFFSNALPPLIALNYADEHFFEEFEKLCGKRYRIFSIIRKGWQQKYGLSSDIEILKKQFELKVNNQEWADNLLVTYEEKAAELRELLNLISSKEYTKLESEELAKEVKEVRNKSAVLDAMSNMLHLFSSLIGYQFFDALHDYVEDKEAVNQNFIYYTQPIKESRFAKIKVKEIPHKIELSKKDLNFSHILRIGSFVKDDVSELLDLRKSLMKNLFSEISKRLGCRPADLEYLQINEIGDFLLKKENPDKLIQERTKLTLLFYPEDSLQVYAGETAEDFLKKGDLKEIVEEKDVKILRGQTGSLGKVTGKVIIALDSDEALKKIKKGEILVAPYTAVEYVPAMEKAAAIITETGGITSHAAIVAREFQIPCIIGVKDVTKILKDGQKVEVDADEGVIRIL